MKDNLINKELTNINKDLKQKIQGLHSFVKSTINDNKSRSNYLRDDCNNLWNSTEELKNLTFELRMRV